MRLGVTILCSFMFYIHCSEPTVILYFRKEVLGLSDEYNMNNLGPVRWQLAVCLVVVFTIVYFAMWKGVKSSGKVCIHIYPTPTRIAFV